MKKSRKMLLVMVIITLILSLFKFNYKVEASTNGMTQDDAINWVKSKLDTTIGSGQCVALISAYYEALGQTSPQYYYAYTLKDQAAYQPSGWQTLEGAYPQKGDILIYLPSAGNEAGHVAIYESEYVTYHQNYLGQYVRQINKHYDQMYDTDNNLMPYWGVVRPDFAPSDTENPVITSAYVDPASMTGSSYTVRVSATDNVGISKIPIMTWSIDNGQDDIKEYRATSDGSGYSYTVKASDHGNNKGLYNSHIYVYDEAGNGVSAGLKEIPMGSKLVKNLGNFEARIALKSDPDYVITADGTKNNSNVMLGKKSDLDESQIWKFNQKSDGSYEIVNIASDRALDITDASDKDGANVAIHTKNDSDAQTFYIMEYNGGYRIVPKCTSNLKAIDLADNKVEEGHNIQLYSAGEADNMAQTWIFDEEISTSIKLDETSLTLTGIGETKQLTATIIPSTVEDKTVIWTTDNASIATVDSSGLVTSVGLGTATITAMTADGRCSVSCKVTVNCAHENTTLHKEVQSTCLVQGNAEYVTCDDCGEVISGSDEKLPLADHNYGDLIEKVEPIHTSTTLEDGMEAHYKCSVCGKLFNENKEEVSEEDLIIKAPLHTYGDWVADKTYHWKECGCGNIIEQAEHTGGEATCVDKAICEVCNLEYGELDPTNHKNTETRDAVEATTKKEGYTGDVYCKDCGELVKKGEVIPVITPEPEDPEKPEEPEDPTDEETKPTEDDEKEPIQPTEDEENEVKPVEEENETIDPTKPQTDDNSNIILWISLLVISGISFVIIAKCNIKRKISKHSK